MVKELLQNHNSYDPDIVDYPTMRGKTLIIVIYYLLHLEPNTIVPKFDKNDFQVDEKLDSETKKPKLGNS